MVTVTTVLLQIIKFTLTCCTVHSLYYSQITRITTIKITAVNIHCNVFFFFLIGCFIMAFVCRRKKDICTWDAPL